MRDDHHPIDKDKLIKATIMLRDTQMSHTQIGEEVGLITAVVARINAGDIGPANEKHMRHLFDYFPIRKIAFEEGELEEIKDVMPLLIEAYQARLREIEAQEKRKKIRISKK